MINTVYNCCHVVVCEAEIITIVRTVLIMMNDYTTAHSDSDTISDTKIAKKSINVFLV